MTDELFNVMDVSRTKNSQQSFITDIEGLQGCLAHNTEILVFRDKYFQNINISELLRTDKVLGFNGKFFGLSHFRKIHTGKKPCFLVGLESGRCIYATANHDMLSWNGFVPVKSKLSTLSIGDLLFTIDGFDKILVKKSVGIQDVYDLQVPNYHNFVLSNGIVVGNSGKSYVGLFECGYIDKNFSVENIFFDFNKLVNNRKELKPHTAVLMDEQTQVFGVDSMRISIMMNAIKDRLRKKNISLVFCSPRLRETHVNSRFVQETLFIDEELKESYVGLKVAQNLQCLGYVVIPHPLTVLSKKLLLEYEKVKDESLDELLNQPIDDVEERAKTIMDDKDFKMAEKVYVDKVGFIPYRTLIQVVNRMFPEFKGSVIVYELCDRIRYLCEVSGRWLIASKAWEKKKLEGEEKKDAKRVPDDVKEDDSEISHLKSIKKKFEPKLKSSQLDMIKQKFEGGGTKSLPKKQRVIRR